MSDPLPAGHSDMLKLTKIDVAAGIVVLGLVFGVFLLWLESPLR